MPSDPTPSDPTSSDRIASDPIDSDPIDPDKTPFEPSIDKVQSAPGPVAAGHLHPLALVFDVFRLVRGFLLPAIPLLLFSRRSSWGIMLMLLAVFALGRAVVRYVSFTYRVEGGELITREGLIGRTERHIRFERIQEVRIEQSLMHRIFGVVEAKVETGSGGGPEATFTVMARRDAEALRAAVRGRQTATLHEASAGFSPDAASSVSQATDRSEREVLRKLSLRDLVLGGLTSNHLVSVFVFIGALWALLDDLLPEDVYQRLDEAIRLVAGRAAGQGLRTAVIIAVVSFSAILATGMVLSVLGSILLFYDFTLARRGEDLERSYGLLTRRSSTLPRRRIQTLAIEEGWLRRLAGLASVRVETVSSRSEDNAEQREGRDLLLPVVPRTLVEDIIPAVFPDVDQSAWRRVSPLAVRRGLKKVAIVALLISIAIFVATKSWAAFAALLLTAFAYPVLKRQYEHLGYSRGERYFHARRGWLGRLRQIVPVRKVQAVEIRQSPFDRRLGLATVAVDTAGQSAARGGPYVRHLPQSEAEALAKDLAHQAAATVYRV